MARNPYDLTPSRVQLMRRQSTETYMVRVYTGALSDEIEYVSVEAGKGTNSEDVVAVVCRKLRLSNSMQQYELAEVFSSGGQLCKERRLGPLENPVALMLLWPKLDLCSSPCPSSSLSSSSTATTTSSLSSSNSTNNSDCYRFYLRAKDPEMPVGGWMVSEQSAVDSFLLAFLTQDLDDREFPDLCSLPDLNEHTLLHNLMARFNQKNIYTYVGSILIAVNPFKFFPIYNPKYVSMYQNKQLGELPPHIFAVADAAYHSMLRHRKNQCIVISGESGSGKTESTNLLLHHLTALSQKGSHGSGVEQTILGAGPVLEAFGNAKTVHNNNSSRFGKFIQVNYKQNGMVHGAVVEKYLLEKSRIVFQAKNERNYHVFYYLLAGAEATEREALHLAKPHEYNYLSQSGCYAVEKVDEEHEFSRLKQSMEMVGFSSETQKKIFSVLSAVLLLGNVAFKKKKGDKHHDESVTVTNEETVQTISTLLRVKEKYVLEALTQKKTTAGDETFIINFKMEDAIATRDAMAKCIYGALFDWIVLKVNQALLAKKHDSDHEGDSIGVLDIFGFEDFGRNSFEQFCINYANEHLQYYFNQHIFKFEQEEYQREGIQWKNIEFIDNTGSLELFYKRPNGLFCLLDEECNFPAATNETLLNKFTHHHKNDPHYQVPQMRDGAFSIKHYAGRVKYFIKDFREKNVDLIRPEIVATLKKSSLTFVRELMGIDPVAVLRWSVVRAFFRCYFAFIKAGEKYRKSGGKESRRRPSKRLSDPSLQDVFSENLLNPVTDRVSATLPHAYHLPRIQGDSWPMDLQYRDQVHQELLLYSLHDSDARIIRRARKLLMKNKSFKPRQRPSLSFRDIRALKAITGRTSQGGNRTSGSKKQPPTVGAQFQSSLLCLMKTLDQANPFFIRCIKSNKEKAPCVFDEGLVMRQLRYTGMLATVKIRQSGYNYRLLFEEFIQLYKILLPRKKSHTKEDIEQFLQSMHLNHENYQIGINKVFLRESEKMHLDEALHTAIMQRVVTIQRWAKTCLERRGFLRLREAAVIVQKYIRRYLVQRDFQEYQQLQQCAAILIQNHFRCYLARRGFLDQRKAVVYIQAYVRAVLTRRKFFQLRDDYYAALAKEEAIQKEQERLEREKQEREERERQEKEEMERLEREEAERIRREKLEARQVVVERLDFERNRERKEELQSTASDEGVLLKASSNEELEDREEVEPSPLKRRDSEESGILEDSDSEMPSTDSGRGYMSLDTAPAVILRSPTQKNTETQDEELARLNRVSKVQEMAKRFQRTPEKDDEVSPTRSQENLSRLDNSKRPAPLQIPRGPPLSDDKKAELESAVARHNVMIAKKDEQIEPADQNKAVVESRGHMSPLHHIKDKFHKVTETFEKSPRKSLKFLGLKSGRRKADVSEEESEESVTSPSRHLGASVGISVLPQLPLPALPLSPRQKNDGRFAGESRLKPDSPGRRRVRPKKKSPRSDKNSSNSTVSSPQSKGNIMITKSKEWQYSENLVIDDMVELALLDQFLSNKAEQLYKDGPGNHMYTFFDRIFKGSLDKFRKDLKSTIAITAKDSAGVKYRDLFDQFRQLLEAELKREHTGTTLLMNAFRGFLDEFRKQQEGRMKDNKRGDDRRMEKWQAKKKKNEKAQDTIDFNGHHYLHVQFNIPTLCEVCSSFLWIMDKGYVCQVCKLACHKRCYSKLTNPCKGSSTKKHPSNQVYGVPLESLITESKPIPVVCERLMSTIERTGLYVVGIYRKCGAAPKIKELKAALDADVNSVDLEEHHIHVLTALLKQFLRDLPEPLLTFDLYDDFLRCTVIKDEKEMVKALFDVINKLPKPNFNLLERLVFHLACVVMHSDSNKMSANALSVIFAPVLLRPKKNMQAQEAIALMPQQMMCVECVLQEEVKTVKSKLDDIDTLESAEKTAGERLNAVRASLRIARKSPQRSPVKQPSINRQDAMEEEESTEEGGFEEESEGMDVKLQAEERALSRHLASIHKEKDKLTYKLPVLETRQASSDEDMLSGDELDNASDNLSVSEDGAVSFSLPASPPSLRHVTKNRPMGPHTRRLPSRYSQNRGQAALTSVSEDDSEACLPEPDPIITICPSSYSSYKDSTSMESSYIALPGLIHFGDDDEIMV